MNPGSGARTLFQDIFYDVVPKTKGRNSTLIAQRNECLIDRYYYYGKVFNTSYFTILQMLSGQFFLSEITIKEVMDDNYDLLSKLKQQFKEKEPDVCRKHFAKKWPHLVW